MGLFKEIPPPFTHQSATTRFILDHPVCYIGNHPGTGKTRSVLDAVSQERAAGLGKTLVYAPKSILETAWLDDARKFTPHLTVSVARAENRLAAFQQNADLIITNHDASKWVADNIHLVEKDFHRLVVDEATAYKNRTAQRSAAVDKIRPHFNAVTLMCGTPMPQGLVDLWFQYYLLDRGERLGRNFYQFRFATHEPEQAGYSPQAIKWIEKAGAREAVADLISDITLIYTLEECIDMPEQVYHTIDIDLGPKLANSYETMVEEAILQLESGDISAVHAAALNTKLLQICSGAVYDGTGKYHVIDRERYELIAELVSQRECSLVAFWWKHQRDQLLVALKKAGVTRVAVLDGDNANHHTQIVRDTQDGKYQVVLAQPKSTSHGHTITRAKTTIWCSPTYESEKYEQFNRRTYRIGQTERTEVIHIRARNTVEEHAYDRLQGKIRNQQLTVDLLRALGAHHKETAVCLS